MLDVAKIVTRSASGKFDNVTFFDRTEDAVVATQAAIPGAIGFPGDFLAVALMDDGEEDNIVDDPAPLASPPDAEDSAATRARQRLADSRRRFIKCFPFDVMNFDLEEFFFKPNDPIPGRMVRTLGKMFDWQKRQGTDSAGKNLTVDSFSLMFTTRVGPPNLGEDYLGAIQQALENNVGSDPAVKDAFAARVGHIDIARLRTEDFDAFFKLGLPKIFAAILRLHGWIVEEKEGIRVYSFTRGEGGGKYEMLHLIMHARREPPHVPGTVDAASAAAYTATMARLFREGNVEVGAEVIEASQGELRANLDEIFARRRKYRGS